MASPSDAISICEEIFDLIMDVPDAGIEFAEGVKDRTKGIQSWIEEHKHCTDKQLEALQNMKAGLERWVDNSWLDDSWLDEEDYLGD
jgi:hypothetical protein